MKRTNRLVLGFAVFALTIGAFGYYVSKHPELLRQLRHTPLTVIVWLLILYALWFGALWLILQVTLRFCRKTLPLGENLLLNAYSTVVNFFVPGQGGIVVRGLYLKKRHGLRVRNYVLSMLLYYACYAVVSTFMLLAASRPWWQTIIGLMVASGASFLAIRWYTDRSSEKDDRLDLSPTNVVYLIFTTIIQAIVQVSIYAVELHAVNTHISLSQAITYTGAANFALFVALTPGAIGIRESFLLFSERLHHVSTANIVAASVIDRAVFLVFLAVLFLLTLGFHAKRNLQITQTNEKE